MLDEVHLWDYIRDENDRKWLNSLNAPLVFTDNQFQYLGDLIIEPDQKNLSFGVKASNDVHIRLDTKNGVSYEICIGGWGNTKSVIRVFNSDGTTTTDLAQLDGNVITPTAFTDVSITWLDGKIKVIVGGDKSFETTFLNNDMIDVCKASFTTGYGSYGIWDFYNLTKKTMLRYFKGCRDRKWNDYYHYYFRFKDEDYKNAVLIKCDDDVVGIDTDNFTKFLDFRIDNPQYMLVFPNIVNNGTIAHFQQNVDGVIPKSLMDLELPPGGFCGRLWESPHYCEKLHDFLLDDPSRFSYEKFHVIPPDLRVSINFFAILHDKLHTYLYAGEDDERFLSVDVCVQNNWSKAAYMGMWVAHFTFFSQEGKFDMARVLGRYKDLAIKKTLCTTY